MQKFDYGLFFLNFTFAFFGSVATELIRLKESTGKLGRFFSRKISREEKFDLGFRCIISLVTCIFGAIFAAAIQYTKKSENIFDAMVYGIVSKGTIAYLIKEKEGIPLQTLNELKQIGSQIDKTIEKTDKQMEDKENS